jgi:lysophospholipid acyltransferase
VFKRTHRAISRWVTFGASAFWHGTLPGYYLAFASIPLLQVATAGMLGVWAPLLAWAGVPPARGGSARALAWRGVCWACTHATLTYCVTAFCLLDAHRALTVWRSWGYAVHVLPLVAWAVGTVASRAVGVGVRRAKEA